MESPTSDPLSASSPGRSYATLTNVNYSSQPMPGFDLKSEPKFFPEPVLQGCTEEGIHFNITLAQPEQPEQPEQKRKRMSGKTKRRMYETAELSLSCEWEECDAVSPFNDLPKFLTHVAEHLNHVEIRLQDGAPDEPVPSFLCLWADCGYESALPKDMVRHVHFHAFHTKIKDHGLAIMKETSIECHLDRDERNIVPDVSEPFMCNWVGCDKAGQEFPEAQRFYWHVVWHAEELRTLEKTTTPFQCGWEDCKSSTATVTKLKDHLRSHGQERRVACPQCGQLFANRSKFFDHCKRQLQQRDDPDVTPFECKYCSKRFALERLLRDHMRTHINPLKCPACDMTCSNQSNLSKHVLFKHSEARRFPCEVCPHKSKTLRDLHSHLKVHVQRKEEKCPYCEYKTTYEAGLVRHIRVKHFNEPSNYACHLCSGVFKRGHYLSKHFGTKHQLQPPKGHSRFQYTLQADGMFRVQTVRFEPGVEEDAARMEAEEQRQRDEEDLENADDPEEVPEEEQE